MPLDDNELVSCTEDGERRQSRRQQHMSALDEDSEHVNGLHLRLCQRESTGIWKKHV